MWRSGFLQRLSRHCQQSSCRRVQDHSKSLHAAAWRNTGAPRLLAAVPDRVPPPHDSYADGGQKPWGGLLLTLPLAATAAAVSSCQAESEKAQEGGGPQSVLSDSLPVYRMSDVAEHKTREKGIWVVYQGGVYNITKFIPNHPGGQDKILMAAGADIEPYWNIYRQHLGSPLAKELLDGMLIGRLHPDDIKAKQEEERKKREQGLNDSNPYARDPILSPVMVYYQRQPINAEPPGSLLTDSWITPIDLWFVRNHHPVVNVVPKSSEADKDKGQAVEGAMKSFNVELVSAPDGGDSEQPLLKLSAYDLKTKFPPHTVVASVQCGGNRRAQMTSQEKTLGSAWDISAISTAKWTGARLRDVLAAAGITEDTVAGDGTKSPAYKHVQFISEDGMLASIPIRKALDRFGDVLLAYEMNDEPLPAKHGFPIRAVVPGHVGVRNVKWVNKIRLSEEEATGPWQRGLAYKGFGPSVKSVEGIDVEKIPSLQEQPVQSAITFPHATAKLTAGEVNTLRGYAYSGGGRGIVRVDVSIDGGKTWKTAELTEGKDQPLDRAWAWTFWECDFDIPETAVGSTVNVICKATDASYNVQPDSVAGIWNLRGINNNAWHRVQAEVIGATEEADED